MTDKIDFVIMWVDGNDEKWLKEKEQYEKKSDNPDIKMSNSKKCYRDWDLLRYWFRGVETFAPWVNRIHFVTYGHLPDWLDLNNKKLNIVKHTDFMPKEALPTYNSRALEINLFRIPDLSEKFVYFNDDTFIIKPVSEDDFFKNNKPRDIAVLCPIKPERYGTGAIQINDTEIINDHFNGFDLVRNNKRKWFSFKYGKQLLRTIVFYPFHQMIGFYEPHLPVSYKKSTFKQLWETEKPILEETTMSRFKNKTNINQWLFRYWQIASGDFEPRKISFGKYYDIYNSIDQSIQTIEKQKRQTVCLNDSDKITDIEQYRIRLSNAFERLLPNKSSFEK